MKFFGEDEFQVTYHFYQNLIYLKNKKEAVLKGTWGWNFTVRWYKMNNEYKVDVVNIQRPQWKKAN